MQNAPSSRWWIAAASLYVACGSDHAGTTTSAGGLGPTASGSALGGQGTSTAAPSSGGWGGTGGALPSEVPSANGGAFSSGGQRSSGGATATGGRAAAGGETSLTPPPGAGGGAPVGGATTAPPTGDAGGSSAVGGREQEGGTSSAGPNPNGGTYSGGASTSGGATGNAGTTHGVPSAGGRATGGETAGGVPETGGAGGVSGTGGFEAAAGRPEVVATPGSTLVTVDVSARYQTFEGWGTSLAWWAYQIGGWSSAKRDQLLHLIVDPIQGLGYNIFRYNIGGGDDPSHEHMGTNREMPGFQSSTGEWNWDADARQTAVLRRLTDVGEDVIIEAFSNSPPYWMTKSGCASGNTDGSDNLRDDAYQTFAAYLVEVTKHYRDELGIVFRTLEPLNEPNAGWWKADGGQEGCHFGASSQQRIIRAVSDELAVQGVAETGVSASDENSMDDALSIISGYESSTLAAMVQINVHSYNGSKRAELRTLAADRSKRLWQSESGPLSVDLASNADAAIFMAGRIIQDLRELRPEAWIEWQVVDPSTTWTSFTVSDAQETWQPLKRFYAQAGFSRYIRPGATFVDVTNPNMVAALAGDGSQLTLVVRNGESTASRSYTFDLTSLPSLGRSVEVHRTSATEDLVDLAPITITDWSFTATVPGYSITTFVIPLAG